MDIFRPAVFRALAAALALPLSALLLAGCNVDSVDSVSAVVSDGTAAGNAIINYSGLYMHKDNVNGSTNGLIPIVYPFTGNHKPTGELVFSIRLVQYGRTLEAFDSAGLTWYGNISSISDGAASFSLSGRTTIGTSVEIAGTLNYDGSASNPQSVMDASWIEPTYYGSIQAKATVSPAVTNSPTTFTIEQSPAGAVALSNTVTLTASGSTYPYDWSGGTSFGTLTVGSDKNTANYRRTGGSPTNSETISVTSDTVTKIHTITFK